MAIFHCSTKTISRSTGRSSVAAAAYRSGTCLTDERTGNTHDYSQRSGVITAVTLLPDGNTCNRAELWNTAEKAEKRKDARTAREWVVALPHELNEQQRLVLATEFAQSLAKRHNVAVDLAIHTPDKKGDQRNHHAHILTTSRCVSIKNGKVQLNDKADIELSNTKRKQKGLKPSSTEIKNIRKEWADLCNQYLNENNHQARIDHRTLAEQGIDREPTKHVGVHATAMERKGQTTECGDMNREVKKNILLPERLEKLFSQSLSEAKQLIDDEKKRLTDRYNKLIEIYQTHEKNKPEEPKGIFALFKQSNYQEQLKVWEKEENIKRSDYLNALHERNHYKPQADTMAHEIMQAHYPKEYEAREKLKKAEQENIKKEQEKKRQSRKKSRSRRSRRRGGFGL